MPPDRRKSREGSGPEAGAAVASSKNGESGGERHRRLSREVAVSEAGAERIKTSVREPLG